MFSDGLPVGFISTLTVESDNENVTLKLFPDVLHKYLKKKYIAQEFSEKLVELEYALIEPEGIVDVT